MFIKSASMTKFGTSLKSAHELAYEAVVSALQKAEMKIKEIDLIVSGYIDFTRTGERNRHFSAMLSSMLKTNVPIICTPNACCSGGVALFTANKIGNNADRGIAVNDNVADKMVSEKNKCSDVNNILVVGAEKLTSTSNAAITDEILMGADMIWEQSEGLIFPAQNALLAQQHMLKYGTTQEDLALIALKNHNNANLNPNARFFEKKLNKDDFKSDAKNPMIASPLKLLDCSVNVDGAAAAILTNDKTDIEIIGSAFATDALPLFERESLTNFKATRIAAEKAYNEAGITSAEVNFAELHDAFTITELVSYEDLGFCAEGKGGEFIRSSAANLYGKLPINTSGGLKAKGHPLSATGVSQIVEIVEQFREEAGINNMRNIQNFSDNKMKYAIAQNIGGAGGSVTVHVLKNNKK